MDVKAGSVSRLASSQAARLSPGQLNFFFFPFLTHKQRFLDAGPPLSCSRGGAASPRVPLLAC